VIELKRSRVSIGDGIRQNLSNQQPEFNAWFFATNQLVLAGNDSEGLRYGTIQTPEKYFLSWKEEEADNSQLKLDKYLKKICRKDRLIELLRDFVLFDVGIKKLPRVHQYFGIKAAQKHVQERRGGILWHTQGSGKSLTIRAGFQGRRRGDLPHEKRHRSDRSAQSVHGIPDLLADPQVLRQDGRGREWGRYPRLHRDAFTPTSFIRRWPTKSCSI